MNASERKLYDLLRSMGLRIVPQAQVGDYTVDFLLPDQRVIVEADGKPYHSNSEARSKDTSRDGELQDMGFLTIHVWTDTVYDSPSSVKKRILLRLYRERGIKLEVRGANKLYRNLKKREQ
jgi:very-short-patch-repair endonuclease